MTSTIWSRTAVRLVQTDSAAGDLLVHLRKIDQGFSSLLKRSALSGSGAHEGNGSRDSRKPLPIAPAAAEVIANALESIQRLNMEKRFQYPALRTGSSVGFQYGILSGVSGYIDLAEEMKQYVRGPRLKYPARRFPVEKHPALDWAYRRLSSELLQLLASMCLQELTPKDPRGSTGKHPVTSDKVADAEKCVHDGNGRFTDEALFTIKVVAEHPRDPKTPKDTAKNIAKHSKSNVLSDHAFRETYAALGKLGICYKSRDGRIRVESSALSSAKLQLQERGIALNTSPELAKDEANT